MRELIKNVGEDYLALAITGVIVLIASLIYLWWNEKNQGKLSIPGLSSVDDSLGNLGQCTPNGGLHQFLLDNHKKLGPMFSFFWGKELAVSIASPVIWKDVQTLFDRPVNQFIGFKPLIGEYSIQYMNTPIGQQHRKLLDRYYAFTSIGTYYETFNEIARELVGKWKTLPKEEMIPLHQHMMVVALKSIVRTSFGKDYFKTNKEILELEQNYSLCWDEMEIRMIGDIPAPESKRQKDFDKALNFLKEKAIQVVNHRRALMETENKNFIDIMLDSDDLYQTDQQIFDMFMTYLVGGFHTTGNLLTWIIYYLSQNEDIIKKMLKEIEEVLGDREFEMKDMDKLVYIKQVIDEGLRCSILAPWAARYSEYDMVIGGHVIPKHTPIILALGCLLQNEKVWPEPKKFDPDRFGPDAPKRHPLAYQPFGFAGKRKCPGYRFAYYEAMIFIVAIVRNFKLSLVPDQKVVMKHLLVTSPKEEIYITVEPRA